MRTWRIVTRRAVIVVLALAAAVAGTACPGSGAAEAPSPLPSGSLGPVTPEAAADAVLGLCEISGATERDAAATTFFDRSHLTLHVIAAATEVADRGASADLLEAKQVIEAELADPVLPGSFGRDVRTLLAATRRALEAIGLGSPPCPA